MQKALVETTGSFQLMDFARGGAMAQAHRPSVVELSTFFQGRVANGNLKLLGRVNDEATDEEFVKYWEDSEDATLAVEAFLASFEVEEVSEKPAAKPKPKATAKPAAKKVEAKDENAEEKA